MISITCTQCQTVLTIDDAFAGGVCRCQHCGTIQTVPSALKATATPQPFVSPSSTKSKTLYQNESAARTTGANVATTGAQSPSGLDDLAQAVGASSGLTGSGLRATYAGTPALAAAQAVPAAAPANSLAYAVPGPETVQKKSPLVPILIGAGVVILLLIGVIVFMMFGRSTAPVGGTITGGGSSGGGASFCGTAITGSSVVYLLDDANSISNDFDPLRAATYQSITSLGADHKFSVILWNNGEPFAYPKDGMAAATSTQVEGLRGLFQDVEATGQSNLRPSLERAMARHPDTIIIVTSKSALDDDDVSALATAQENAGGKIKFDTFTVGSSGENGVLKMTAKATGGEYRHISSQELRGGTP